MMYNNNIISSEPYLTPRQAAGILNVSLSTLKKLIYLGKIKTLKTPGGHHRISKAFLSRFEAIEAGSHSCENNEGKCLLEIVDGFIKIMESRMRFGKNHSSSVAALSVMLGKKMGVSSEQLHNIKLAALLHDIGKLSIDSNILDKTESLTVEEYNTIKKHAVKGFDMLNFIKPLRHLAAIVGQHHERYDGSGYPESLKKNEICIEARIISLTESFDAMTSADSYKKTLPSNIALEKIAQDAGRYFDPEVTSEFLQLAKYNFTEVLK